MTDDNAPQTPYTAHSLLGIRTVTVTVEDAARLLHENAEMIRRADEQRERADAFQNLAETVTAREQALLVERDNARRLLETAQRDLATADELAGVLRARVEHHIERRAIPAGIKWQTLIEALRERGLDLDKTDTAPTELAQLIVSATGTTYRDMVRQALDMAQVRAEQATADVVAEAMTAAPALKDGTRVRLVDATNYKYAPHGAEGVVVEAGIDSEYRGGMAIIEWDATSTRSAAYQDRLAVIS